MRVLICGGRDFTDYSLLNRTLIGLSYTGTLGNPRLKTIIHGGARGADTLASQWASIEGLPVEEFPADWEKHGKAAGHIRNKKMLDEGKPDLVVAFPGGKGTANMVKQAKEAGVEVYEVSAS